MTLLELSTAIQTEYTSFLTTSRTSVEHAKRTGELLIEAKGQVPHGDWLLWLSQHTKLGPRVAQKFMRIASEWEVLCAKASGETLLTITAAYQLLITDSDESACIDVPDESPATADPVPIDDAADPEPEDEEAAETDEVDDDPRSMFGTTGSGCGSEPAAGATSATSATGSGCAPTHGTSGSGSSSGGSSGSGSINVSKYVTPVQLKYTAAQRTEFEALIGQLKSLYPGNTSATVLGALRAAANAHKEAANANADRDGAAAH